MSIVVRTDPVMEAIARKLSGFEGVPPIEKSRMIRRAAKAGAQALRDAQDAVLREMDEHALKCPYHTATGCPWMRSQEDDL